MFYRRRPYSSVYYRFVIIILTVTQILLATPVSAGPDPVWLQRTAQAVHAPLTKAGASLPLNQPRPMLDARNKTVAPARVKSANLAVSTLNRKPILADAPAALVPPDRTLRLARNNPPRLAPAAALLQASSGITLSVGWNLVSLPVAVADTNPATVLASLAGKYEMVMAYNGCDTADPWKLYNPSGPAAANDLTALDHTLGFWIKMTAPGVLNVVGTTPATTNIPLCNGWNLVGYPLAATRSVNTALASIQANYLRVFGHDVTNISDPWAIFDTTVPAWANELQVMEPGKGYWLYAKANTTLVYSQTDTPLTVTILGPTDGISVTAPSTVSGTIDSSVVAGWDWQYRLQGDADWITLASGSTASTNLAQAKLDPTLLLNGIYELRLTATNAAGKSAEALTAVTVEGDMKIGNFAISLIDLAVPVAGIPIQVIRSYDSRDKHQGDFGVGWTLDLRNVRVQKNGLLGDNWEGTVTSGFTPTYCIRPTKRHVVMFTLNDGTVFKFEPVLSPQCQVLFSIDSVTVAYRPLPGTTATLEGSSFVKVSGGFPGEISLTDFDTLDTFDPTGFQLRLRDGTLLDVQQGTGLRYITDRNGNQLAVSSAGITHSSGKGITFTRDALNRITRITDPLGKTINYSYNATGDLASVTDQENRQTQFRYDNKHNLGSIIDPRGIEVAANNYGPDNRLVASQDADGNRMEFTHDLDNDREVVRDRLGNETVFEYNARGDVTRQTDALGHVTTMTYDNFGNELTHTDALGRTASKTYDANQNILSQRDEDGHLTTFTYNGQSQPLTITDDRGRVIQNSYDAKGNLASYTDGEGAVTHYAYDATGNLTSITDALGHVTTRSYDSSGNQTASTDALGNMTAMSYDANNRMTSETRTRTLPDGTHQNVTLQYTYDAKGNLISDIDPNGNTFTVNNNVLDKPDTVVNKLGAISYYQYDDRGYLVRMTDANGGQSAHTYDLEGRELSSTNADGHTTRYTYNALGQRVAEIAPDGGAKHTGIDAVGRVISQTDELGNVTRIAYTTGVVTTTNALGQRSVQYVDSDGNTTASVDAAGHTTTFIYDKGSQFHGEGRLTETHLADGTTTHTEYDANGRVIAQTDQAGVTTHFEYDALGRLSGVRDALGNLTSYGYDALGRQVTQTDALGRITRFEYDLAGHMTARILPLGQREGFTYDANGNRLSHTNFNGETITFTYDSNNRLIAKHWPDGKVETFSYTADGLRLQAGGDHYAYDAVGRLISEIKASGQVITYTYDLAGNRTAVGIPTGVTRYTYDALNRMQTVIAPDGGVTRYTYDTVGNLASTTLPNGIVTTYRYDDLHRLLALESRKNNGDLVASYVYTLNATGRRQQVVEAPSGRTVRYGYDALYRLTSETISHPISGTQIISYTYDAVGNRLTKSDSTNGVTIYHYDANDSLLQEDGVGGVITYNYDTDGNLVNKATSTKTVTYTYDAENRLIGVNDGVVRVIYGYDVDGLRIREDVGSVSGINFLVDKNRPFAEVLLDSNTSDVPLVSYVRGIDLISQQQPGSDVNYYVYDGQFSVRYLTNHLGNATDAYNYDAFGNLNEVVGSTVNSYQYTGQQLDRYTDSYYLRTRYYFPKIGRFLTMDTFTGIYENPNTLHKYSYVEADPINNIDPNGQLSLQAQIQQILRVLGVNIVISPDVGQYPDSTPLAGHTLSYSQFIEVGIAQRRAQFLVTAMQTRWNDPETYNRYFGKPNPSRATMVRTTWAQLFIALTSPAPGIRYGYVGECANGTIAMTPRGQLLIYLCTDFFRNPENQPRTIIHELHHAVTGYQDAWIQYRDSSPKLPAYGVLRTAFLASVNPDAAVTNPDNYALQALQTIDGPFPYESNDYLMFP
ncbi:MAG: RHS repeat-associated core domain-containing protein [Caldilineaceae bacterium]